MTTKAKTHTRESSQGVIPGLVEEWEDVERPANTRNKYPTDTLIVDLLKTVETGRAKRIKTADQAGLLRKLHMHFRHMLRQKDCVLHFKKLDEQTMFMWAEKVKETTK